MAHSYTPGLKVLNQTSVTKERRLPLRGEVVVKKGCHVLPNDKVARTFVPGNVVMLNIANKLNIDSKDIAEVMKVSVGASLKKGDVIAESKGMFGFFKSEVTANVDGTIESISTVTGQVIMREPPVPLEVEAYMSGIVDDVISEEGVIVKSYGAFIQGIFGIGGEKYGQLQIISESRKDELRIDQIDASLKGKIIVGGSFVSLTAFKKAMDVGVAGIVVGGFNYFDLKAILGYTLGVAITGSESIPTSLIVTEGYGRIPMGDKTFALLKQHTHSFVSINGATQIRAGVIRPEIVIPFSDEISSDDEVKEPLGIGVGSLARIIRSPHFGEIGKVIELPKELQKMESETMVRVAKIDIEGSEYIVPRSNLELVETT